jgi:adenylate cyclase class 2
MQQEIEAKFLNVDLDDVRARLKKAGAELKQPMRLMRRAIIDYPDRRMQTGSDAWIRVRDEGDKITLTYKSSKEHAFGGAHEIETRVSDYGQTVAIFQAIGLKVHAEQESKRETWQMNDVEIVLDEWPWLKPYIEIEGPTEESVQAAANTLGFDWQQAVFGSVTTAYRSQYPDITKDEHISTIPKIMFSEPRPDWFFKA